MERATRASVSLIAAVAVAGLLFPAAGCASRPAAGTQPAPAAIDTAAPAARLAPEASPGYPPAVPPASVAASPALTPSADVFSEQRARMVEVHMRGRDITDESVLGVMARVPRHEFVPKEYLSQAYADHPLPIGYGQTISQPYIVALMTQLLGVKPGDRILEIGTGSGYQAAVLAELTEEVYTLEIIPELADGAAERLQRLGYTHVHVKNADGYDGWPEHAPYDAIIVTAAPDHIPQPLVQQLKDGGRLVIPVGPPGGYQTLWQITKKGDQAELRNVTGVLFVPLTRSTN